MAGYWCPVCGAEIELYADAQRHITACGREKA